MDWPVMHTPPWRGSSVREFNSYGRECLVAARRTSLHAMIGVVDQHELGGTPNLVAVV